MRTSQLTKKKTILIILHNPICNAINYNVIFMDKIHFNIMTMMLIYYWMARKYLFYYCDVNWCCCVVREVVNLSITGWIDKKYKYNLASDTILHRWKYRRNVSIGIFQWRWEQFLFFLTLFMMLITHGYADRMFPSVYSSSDENYSLLKALIIKAFFTNRITHEMRIPMPLQLILFFTVW